MIGAKFLSFVVAAPRSGSGLSCGYLICVGKQDFKISWALVLLQSEAQKLAISWV